MVFSISDRFVAALVVLLPTGRDGQIDVERAREMRFGLRLIFGQLHQTTQEGTGIRDNYINAIRAAVDPGDPSVRNIRTRTADALVEIIRGAPWGFYNELERGQQPINQTLDEFRDGFRRMIHIIDLRLYADGSVDREFSDEEKPDETETPKSKSNTGTKKPRRKRTNTDGRTTTPKGPGNRSKRPEEPNPWLPRENIELLKVLADKGIPTNRARATELNKRMVKIRENAGEPQKHPRTEPALRQQRDKLRKAGITIASLEAQLRGEEDAEEDEEMEEAGEEENGDEGREGEEVQGEEQRDDDDDDDDDEDLYS